LFLEEGLKKTIGLQGISLCGTGTSYWAAHAFWSQLYPEAIIPPDSIKRLEKYLEVTPPPRTLLESLNTSLKIMCLKLFATLNLNQFGIDPMNARESSVVELIVEPRMIYNIGVKAIGTLNSSRERGVKNFLFDDR